jgi:hypothetical protein
MHDTPGIPGMHDPGGLVTCHAWFPSKAPGGPPTGPLPPQCALPSLPLETPTSEVQRSELPTLGCSRQDPAT